MGLGADVGRVQLDDGDKLAVSLWGNPQGAGPGQVSVQLTPSGYVTMAGGSVTDSVPGIAMRGTNDSNGVLGVGMMGFQEGPARFDAWRSGTERTLLASASRTVSTTSPTQTFYNLRGIFLFLNVTVNPGGAETLTLRLLARDPITGTLVPYVTGTAQFGGGGTGAVGLLVSPGVLAADHTLGVEALSSALTRQGAAQVVHSAAGAWTYSLGAAVIV